MQGVRSCVLPECEGETGAATAATAAQVAVLRKGTYVFRFILQDICSI